MATHGPVMLPTYIDSDATFRTWCQGIHDALIAVGLVQTSDTGQIDLATVVINPISGNASGYEIFRLNDTLQATVPIFIKIEYGPSGTRPRIWITTGSGTDGAGDLTFISLRREVVQGTVKSLGVLLPCYASGDGSRFTLAFSNDMITTADHTCAIGVERTKDSSGIDTGDGWIVLAAGSGTGSTVGGASIMRPGVANNSSFTNGPCIPPMSGGLNIVLVNENIAIGTMLYYIGLPFYGISLISGALSNGPLTGYTLTANVLGVVRTYMVFGSLSGACMSRFVYNNLPNMITGMLWE